MMSLLSFVGITHAGHRDAAYVCMPDKRPAGTRGGAQGPAFAAPECCARQRGLTRAKPGSF